MDRIEPKDVHDIEPEVGHFYACEMPDNEEKKTHIYIHHHDENTNVFHIAVRYSSAEHMFQIMELPIHEDALRKSIEICADYAYFAPQTDWQFIKEWVEMLDAIFDELWTKGNIRSMFTITVPEIVETLIQHKIVGNDFEATPAAFPYNEKMGAPIFGEDKDGED